MRKNLWVILTGAAIGAAALLLTALGNPGNMGFCIACFERDIAGSLRLHGAEAVQYFRPEIAGIVLGALILALCRKEFRPRGGSSPVTRVALGFAVMVGALMFLGCPLRMIIRLGGGDGNALLGLAGFIAGVGVGVICLNKGFSLGRSHPQAAAEGAALPAVLAGLFAVAAFAPSLLAASAKGPGSLHAPLLVSLAGGLLVGALAQRSRFCMAGGIRDTMLFRDLHLLWGTLSLLAVLILGNLILGKFKPGFADQPVAHTDGLWNFAGMIVVGWGGILLGGCPLRQLVLTGEGDGDAALAVLGMVLGAACCHNFGWASSAAGPTDAGRAAVAVALAVLGVVSVTRIVKEKR